MATFAASISVSGNDGVWVPSLDAFDTTADNIAGKPGSVGGVSTHFYLRFTNVTIGQGDTIDSAVINLVAGVAASTTTVNLTIAANDADNPGAPGSSAAAEGLTLTTATVAWNNVPTLEAEQAVASPSIVSVIQEIVDRPGWVSGNSILLVVRDNGSSTNAARNFASWDHATLAAPSISIDYTEAAGPQSITLNAIAAGTQVHQMGISPGAASVGLNHIAATTQAHQMGVSPGAASIALNHLGPTSSPHLMGVVPQAVDIALNHLGPTSTLYQMSVAQAATQAIVLEHIGGAHGPNFPSSDAVLTAGVRAWSNPEQAYGDDGNVMAASNVTNTNDTDTHRFGGYGFGVSGTVGGIEVAIEAHALALSVGSFDFDVQLFWNGSVQGSAKVSGTIGPGFPDAKLLTLGGPADLWGTTPTAADINRDDFGVTLHVASDSSDAVRPAVDYVSISVYAGGLAAVYAPAVAHAPQAIALNAIAATAQVFQAAVSPGAATVALSLLGPTATLYQMGVIPEQALALDHLGPTSALYQMSVARDEGVNFDHLGPTSSLFQLGVTPGAASIVLNHLAGASSAFSPAIAPGPVSIVLAAPAPTSTLYQMSASPGAATVVFDQFGPLATVHPMSLFGEQFIVLSAPVAATEVFAMFAGIRGPYWQLSGILSRDVRYMVADTTPRYLVADTTPHYSVTERTPRYLTRDTTPRYRVRRSR